MNVSSDRSFTESYLNFSIDTLLPPNPFVTRQEWDSRVKTAAIYLFITSWGVVLNATPILLTICTKMRYKKIHIMVANLSTADLLCSLSFVIGQWRYILYREQLSPVGCQWLGFVSFTTSFYEFFFPVFLSVNRYVSLYSSQQRYDRIYSGRNIGLMVVGSWAFCVIIPLIFTLMGKAGFDVDNVHCCIIVKTNSPIGWSVFYWASLMLPLIAFCDGTMLFCNYKIYKKLHDHSSAQTLKQNVVRQHKEILYFLIADMCVPICIHIIYHVAKFASYNRTDIVQKRVFSCLYLLNSCVRGSITLSMLRPYRQALKNTLKCACFRKGGGNFVMPIVTNAIAGGPTSIGHAKSEFD